MNITVGVVVITQSPDFFSTGLSVLNDISSYVFDTVTMDAQLSVSVDQPIKSSLYTETRNKSIAYLQNSKAKINIDVIQSPT
ncbi:MAG: hypothetical protein OXE99_09485, partial [Cellvibrionales bacterium]|nr:hypothetical protein [Cellvibrionales bacterium]